MPKSLTIFVDSDAFVAFVKQDDSNHKKARRIFESLQAKSLTFVTSNYVFSEVITVISQRVDHKTAVAFIDNMRSEDSDFLIERISETVEEKALQLFREQTSKNISFVDCTNIALILEKHMDAIFSFDNAYKKNGILGIESL